MTFEQSEKLKNIVRRGFVNFGECASNFAVELFEFAESELLLKQPAQPITGANVSPIETKSKLNKKELAAFLGISERLISDLQNDGLPFEKLGRRNVYDRVKVLKWIEQRKIKPNRKTKPRVIK